MQTISVNTKVSVVTVAAAVIAAALMMHFATSTHSVRSQAELFPGMRLSPPKGYDWSSHKRSLVLVLRVGCSHCENEMEFYERLLSLERDKRTRAFLVAFFPDSKPQVDEALSGRLTGLSRLANVDFASLMVPGTPTLFLVDEGGLVKSVWIGELTADEKQSVIDMIAAVD
jgi:hypothetical protein